MLQDTFGNKGNALQGSPVPYLSSELGQQKLQETKQKMDTLSPPLPPQGTTPAVPIGQTDEQRQRSIKEGKQLPEGKSASGYSLDEILSLTKDMTGWQQNPDGTYTPDSTALKNLGVTNAGAGQEAAQAAMESAKAERDSAYAKLTSFDVSNDPALQGIITGITAQWDSRISEMERVNKGREAAIRTTGVRLGSRYTGGAGGVMGSIISEEERQGIERVAELDRQKQAAIAEAKSAYSNQQWNRYYQLAGVADKKYQEQRDAVKELNDATAKQNQKLEEERKKQELSDNIYNTVAKLGDKADVASIYASLRNTGYGGTIQDVESAWKALQPKESESGLYKFTQGQVGQLLQYGFSGEDIQTMQDDLNLNGLQGVVSGLPKEAQSFISGILHKTPAGNGITWAEAAARFGAAGYPEVALQLAGKSEEQILNDIQNPAPPPWFMQYLKGEGVDIGDKQMDYLPEAQQKIVSNVYGLWDAFRTKVFSSQSGLSAQLFSALSSQPSPVSAAAEEGQ